MEFNFKVTDYDSPKAMFNGFSISEDKQRDGFCTFIVKYNSGSLLKAYQSRNFTNMVQIYNVGGNTYGPKLQANTTDLSESVTRFKEEKCPWMFYIKHLGAFQTVDKVSFELLVMQ